MGKRTKQVEVKLLEPKIMLKGLDKSLKGFEKRLRRVKQRTIMTVAKRAKIEWSRLIAQETKLPVTKIKKSLHLSVKTEGGVLTFIAAHWRGRVPLLKYPGGSQNARGIRLKGGKIILHAFIATMPGGHTGIFKREGRSRLPIQELYYRFDYVIDAAEKVLPQVMQKVAKDWETILARQINYEFNVTKK